MFLQEQEDTTKSEVTKSSLQHTTESQTTTLTVIGLVRIVHSLDEAVLAPAARPTCLPALGGLVRRFVGREQFEHLEQLQLSSFLYSLILVI